MRIGLSDGFANRLRIVDLALPRHGEDQPHGLTDGEQESSLVLGFWYFLALALVEAFELLVVHLQRVGRFDQVVSTYLFSAWSGSVLPLRNRLTGSWSRCSSRL